MRNENKNKNSDRDIKYDVQTNLKYPAPLFLSSYLPICNDVGADKI